MIRLFAALAAPPEIGRALQARQTGIEGARWRPLEALHVTLRFYGEVRQDGHVRQMTFPIPVLIEYISAVMTLEPGDVIATGTPAGVGALHDGDAVEVEIPGVARISNRVRKG